MASDRFDWTNRTPIVFDRTSVARVEAINSGTAHAVFMWWDITMDPTGEVRDVAGTAPGDGLIWSAGGLLHQLADHLS